MPAALRLALLAPLLLLLAACQTVPQHKVHQSLLNASNTTSGGVIVLPLDVKVKEFSAGGLKEEVPAWTEQAKANFHSLLENKGDLLLLGEKVRFTPELSDDEKQQLDEYIALSNVLMDNARYVTSPFGGPAWVHKAKHFDYTLGPGLSFLADKTGYEKGLIIIGEDVHSTEGRKATAILLSVLTRSSIALGHNVAIAALIDLRTGDLLWMHHTVSGTKSFLNRSETEQVLDSLFAPYPGIDDYRKFAESK